VRDGVEELLCAVASDKAERPRVAKQVEGGRPLVEQGWPVCVEHGSRARPRDETFIDERFEDA